MPRSFAIVPAAGRSRRMGEPKLLLDLGGRRVIDRVLGAWLASGVDEVLAVRRADDTPLAAALAAHRVTQVAPAVDPPEMKDSVAAAIAWLAVHRRPTPTDCWLLAPADAVGLSPVVIDALLAAANGVSPAEPRILVPSHAGRRGHPVVIPWCWADEVARLGPHEGVNQLLHRHPVELHDVADPLDGGDLDTPADYAAWRKRYEQR